MFEWKDSYISGFKSIDEQHYQLFEVAREVVELVNADNRNMDERFYNAYEKLLHYTIYHFTTEEELWQIHDTVEYQRQKSEHRAFVLKLDALDLVEMESDRNAFLNEMLEQLSNWIGDHVYGELEKIKRIHQQLSS